MAAKFEIYKDKAGESRFRLKAGNGEIVLSSEGYKSKSSCQNGIESVKKNATNAKNFEVSQTKSGKTRFNLKASNGQVIGVSQSYASDSSCQNGVDCVKRDAPGAEVVDLS